MRIDFSLTLRKCGGRRQGSRFAAARLTEYLFDPHMCFVSMELCQSSMLDTVWNVDIQRRPALVYTSLKRDIQCFEALE